MTNEEAIILADSVIQLQNENKSLKEDVKELQTLCSWMVQQVLAQMDLTDQQVVDHLTNNKHVITRIAFNEGKATLTARVY